MTHYERGEEMTREEKADLGVHIGMLKRKQMVELHAGHFSRSQEIEQEIVCAIHRYERAEVIR